jgi:hypothetical protein
MASPVVARTPYNDGTEVRHPDRENENAQPVRLKGPACPGMKPSPNGMPPKTDGR